MANEDPLDPKFFDAGSTSPELTGFVEAIEKAMPKATEQAVSVEAAEAARRGFEENPFFQLDAVPDKVETRTIAGPAGDLPIRLYVPSGPVRGAMLHIHGGGWVVGKPEMSDAANTARSEQLGLAIASVDYRLAPEHPYPAGPDDCEAAASWLIENAAAEFGAPADKICVGGESAGGHLAAVTALRMRRRHGYKFAAANLVYGLYDLSGVPSHTAFDDRNVILDSTNIKWFTDCFVPDESTRRDPDISPLYADLSDAPPALFTVGTLDPLLDHTLFLYAKWRAAGNHAELQVFPGAPHGFDAFPVPEGRQASKRMDAFLASCLA
jgi:acetyl esterase